MQEKDIQNLITYIEEGQKRIDDAKKKLVSQSDDFDLWVKYGEKNDFEFLLGVDNPIRLFLDQHCSWLYKENRYMVIDLKWMICALEELYTDGQITEYDVEKVKKALLKSNYGSMKINW